MPQKKYHVDLTDDERAELEKLLRGGKHKSRKLTRARILLLADAGKTDAEIVGALSAARPTVERTRQRFVEQGLGCLDERLRMGARPRLSERQQAHLIAVACTEAPGGRARWTLQLLADKAVELKFVTSIARESVRQLLKKHIEVTERHARARDFAEQMRYLVDEAFPEAKKIGVVMDASGDALARSLIRAV